MSFISYEKTAFVQIENMIRLWGHNMGRDDLHIIDDSLRKVLGEIMFYTNEYKWRTYFPSPMITKKVFDIIENNSRIMNEKAPELYVILNSIIQSYYISVRNNLNILEKSKTSSQQQKQQPIQPQPQPRIRPALNILADDKDNESENDGETIDADDKKESHIVYVISKKSRV